MAYIVCLYVHNNQVNDLAMFLLSEVLGSISHKCSLASISRLPLHIRPWREKEETHTHTCHKKCAWICNYTLWKWNLLNSSWICLSETKRQISLMVSHLSRLYTFRGHIILTFDQTRPLTNTATFITKSHAHPVLLESLGSILLWAYCLHSLKL